MLMTLIPLFDENMAVKAYSIYAQKNNFLLNPMLLGTASNDGASEVPGLEVLQTMGIETLAEDMDVFVPLTNISVFADIASQCDAPHERIVLLIDNTVPPVEMYINRLKELKSLGYKLAIRRIAVVDFETYKPIISLMDYVILNNRKVDISKAKIYFSRCYPNVKLVAGGIDTKEIYDELAKSEGYKLYEGIFYRVAITKGDTEVAPLKVNYIKLLNIVNAPNFELTEAADTIARDTALTINLLKMVNTMTVNKGVTTIRHAASMLGQKELKKWINTAVVGQLYADKANEITRLSMLRAKFAENLAEAFNLSIKKDELFVMGLFSCLDVILEKDMKSALDMVKVGKDIKDALVSGKGKFAPVLDFMIQYETANWPEVSRQMVLMNLDTKLVSDAYMDSLRWYRELMSEK